jgi:hypothetical protein
MPKRRSESDSIAEKDVYFAGLLFADGYFSNLNHPSDNVNPSVCLKLIDKNTVKDFKKWIGANSVRKYEPKTGKDYFRASSTNPEKFQFLDYHGVVSKVQISSRLAENRHFWRGFIDGDGSVRIREDYGKRPVVSASNQSPVILSQLKSFSKCFENSSILVRDRDNTHYYRLRAKSKRVAQFVVELYAGASVYLDRKIETAHKIAELNGS